MINADWLAAFAAFAEYKSFTHAASALHLTQPALFAQVKKLGEELGVPLYQRAGRNLELTEAGRRVAAFARDSAERARGLRDELAVGEARLPVVIAAGEGAFLYLLGPGLSKAARGRAPLRLLTRDREQTLEAVRTGEAHLGVTVLESTPEDLDATLLAAVSQKLVVPKGHRLASRKAAKLSDLEGERLIVAPAARPHRAALVHVLSAAGVSAEMALEANGWPLMLHFVRLGLGVAVVNGCCAAPAGTRDVALPELAKTRYYLLKRKSALPAAAEVVAGILRKEIV